MANQNPIRCLVVGTGSLGVLDLPTYWKALHNKGFDCKCVLTAAATRFLPIRSLGTLTDVYTDDDLWASTRLRVPHISLAKWAELIIYLPCSANTVGKLAHGIADNLATLVAVCSDAPKVVFPNMESAMALNPIVQANLDLLQKYGYVVWREMVRGFSVGLGTDEETIIVPEVNKVVSLLELEVVGKISRHTP